MLSNQGTQRPTEIHLDQGGICISWAQSKMLMVRSMWGDMNELKQGSLVLPPPGRMLAQTKQAKKQQEL